MRTVIQLNDFSLETMEAKESKTSFKRVKTTTT